MEPSFSLGRAAAAEEARRSVLANYAAAPARDRYWLHALLFVLTLASTAFTAGQFGRDLLWQDAEALFNLFGFPVTWPFLADGLRFGVSLLLFLTVHEFGHYFAARWHGVSTSLPYYIPSPLIGIGTLGAVIRIREPVPSLRKLFDIGVAGPLAGFVVALGVLVYALATLPPPTYLFDLSGHEALKAYILEQGTFPPAMLDADDPAMAGPRLVVGQTLLYWLMTQFAAGVPPMYEMYHYPVLFAGWLGLFFTALNLMPVGQLDGGHILYALVGPRWHERLARGFVVLLLVSTAIGTVDGGLELLGGLVPGLAPSGVVAGAVPWILLAAFLYLILRRVFPGDLRTTVAAMAGIIAIAALAKAAGPPLTDFGWMGWWLWCGLLAYFIRIEHPPVLYSAPLTPTRRALGILSLIIFILCFSIRPLYVV
ncbi:MAG: site-2 protease family protein [Rhodothermales bacterium]|nr:site-2 protease family protein [Rhodothermales bacterium]